MRQGYIRHTNAAEIESRHRALVSAGCHQVRVDKSEKPASELIAVLEELPPGGELVVVQLDELGGSTRDVLKVVQELKGKGIQLQVLQPNINSRDQSEGIVFKVLEMIAHMERRFIKRRLDESRARIAAEGRTWGRPPSVNWAEVRRLFDAGMSRREISTRMGVAYESVAKHLREAQRGRERLVDRNEIKRLFDGGLTRREIAAKLGVSYNTVTTHLRKHK